MIGLLVGLNFLVGGLILIYWAFVRKRGKHSRSTVRTAERGEESRASSRVKGPTLSLLLISAGGMLMVTGYWLLSGSPSIILCLIGACIIFSLLVWREGRYHPLKGGMEFRRGDTE